MTVCSAEFSNSGGVGSAIGDWRVQNCCGSPRIVLPGGSISLAVTFEPLAYAQYNQDYTSTLTLNIVTKAIDSDGNCSYKRKSRPVEVKARYEFHHYDGTYQKPWIGGAYVPDEMYIEAGMNRMVDNIIPDMPWVDIPIPGDSLQIFDFYTLDPAVKSVQVFDAQNNLVADVGKSFPAVHVSFAAATGQVFGIKAVGVKTTPGPLPVQPSSREYKTVLKCKKKVLLHAGNVTLSLPITQATLVRNRLLIASGRDFLIYDVSNPTKPAKISAAKMGDNLVSFAVSQERRTRGSGFLLICTNAAQLTSYELAGFHSATPSSIQLSQQSVRLSMKNPVHMLMQSHLCLVAAEGGISLYDIYGDEQPRLMGEIQSNSKVRDALWIRQKVFLATERGVEIISLKKPSSPERLNIIATSMPVTSLQTDGLYLYANLASDSSVLKDKESTLLINLLDLKATKPVGQYRLPIWLARFITADDLALTLSQDRKQLKLYTCQAALAQRPHT